MPPKSLLLRQEESIAQQLGVAEATTADAAATEIAEEALRLKQELRKGIKGEYRPATWEANSKLGR